eukprot:1159420-Pelagomonas_calceolata.AAC.1
MKWSMPKSAQSCNKIPLHAQCIQDGQGFLCKASSDCGGQRYRGPAAFSSNRPDLWICTAPA